MKLELPPLLAEYLSGQSNTGASRHHLKILATFAIPNSSVSASGDSVSSAPSGVPEELPVPTWAVFASVKDAKPHGDADLPAGAVVKDPNGQDVSLAWDSHRPLWLIPMTRAIKSAVLKALAQENGASFLPEISAGEFNIWNRGGSGPSGPNYFWPDAMPSEEKPETVQLAPDSKLRELCGKGRWRILQVHEDEEPWPVWLMTGTFGETGADRAIHFSAPACHLVDGTGETQDYSLWFGVRRISVTLVPHPIKGSPVLSISSRSDTVLFRDCPIVWSSTSRLDDWFIPENRQNEVKGWAWTDDWPIAQRNGWNMALARLQSDRSTPWLLREIRGTDAASTRVRPVYARRIDHLPPLHGADTIRQSLGHPRALQISRGEHAFLIVRFSALDVRSLFAIWNEQTQTIRDGLDWSAAGKPIAVAPVLQAMTSSAATVIQWRGGNSVVHSCQAGYDLTEIGFPKSDGTDWRSFSNQDIALPSIRPDQEGSVLELIRGALITSEKDTDRSWSNDNGTMFQLLLKSFRVANLRLRDGSLQFVLKEEASVLPSLPQNTLWGRFRLTMQYARARRPFFPWQFHRKLLVPGESLRVGYSVESFSLPVNQVEPAGQDAIDEEAFLAPGSLGAVVEGAGERREPALVIPLPAGAAASSGGDYLLTFSESVNTGQNHRLDLLLQEVDPTAGTSQSGRVKAVVIDSNPQMTALVDCQLLQQPGNDDGAWVLARRSPLSEEKGGWELLDDAASTQGFRLVLPAQVIGEAVVKNEAVKTMQVRFTLPAAGLDPGMVCLFLDTGGVRWLSVRGFDQEDLTPGGTFDAAFADIGVEFQEQKARLEAWFGHTSFPNPTVSAEEKSQIVADSLFIARASSPLVFPSFSPAPGEPGEDQPIDHRFGAPAILRLAPERLKRRYVAVPWNLRRIWGQAGDAAPGTPLLEARYETLYGLTAHLRPQKAFLAELGSKLGEVPVPPVNSLAWKPTAEQSAEFRAQWTRYLRFYRAWQSRLGVLEPSVDDGFGGASFSEGVSYRARVELGRPSSADPLIQLRGAELRWPLTASQWTSLNGLVSTAVDAKVAELAERLRAVHGQPPAVGTAAPEWPVRDGLAGGFHYGFESFAIYLELWREMLAKGSSSGEIRSMAWSPIGAWSRETARFAKDKSSVKWTTGAGRTHFYAVERIGRIGAFWNKARHVIEYERTVLPSRQFSHLPRHAGRPLVRKVREFIELLEPVRRYPDFPSDEASAPGAVMSCTFKSKIIPVLSTWSSDYYAKQNVTDQEIPVGWQIPLWKRGADPEVYPKPQILLELTASPEADEKSVMVNLSEPENLWFYTDTREKALLPDGGEIEITADVHAWPPIPEVDFTIQPSPKQFDISPAADDSPELMDAPLPDALDISPGFERWTFRVEPAEIPAAVATRYFPASGVTGRLRTVTMMRSSSLTEHDGAWWVKSDANKALAACVRGSGCLLERVGNGFVDIENKVRRDRGVSVTLPTYHTHVLKVLQEARPQGSTANEDRLAHLIAGLGTGASAPQLSYFSALWVLHENTLGFPTNLLWKEALQGADSIVSQVAQFIDQQRNKLIAELTAVISSGAESLHQANQELDRFSARVNAFRLRADFTVDAAFTQVQSALDRARAEIYSALDASLDHLKQWIADVDPSTDIAKFKNEINAEIEKTFLRLIASIQGLCARLRAIKTGTWQAEIDSVRDNIVSRLQAWSTKLQGKVTAGSTEASSLVREVRAEIESTAGEYLAAIRSEAEKIHTYASELVDEVLSLYSDISSALQSIWDGLYTELDDTLEAIRKDWDAAGKATLTGVREKIDTAKEEIVRALAAEPNGLLWKALYRAPHGAVGDPASYDLCVFKALLTLKTTLESLASKVISSLLQHFGGAFTEENVIAWLETLDAYTRLQDAILRGDRAAILGASVDLANRVNADLGLFAGEIAEKAKAADTVVLSAQNVAQEGQRTLSNYQSVWNQFTAPGMGFNRKTISMLVNTDWKDVENRLSLTPVMSRVKQFGKDLEGLGLRLPTVALTDRLLPPMPNWENIGKSLLDKFGFSNLLSDIGGMRLDKLFPGFKMPAFARDNIRVTQGFEKQTLTAWVNAEADIKLSGKKTLMNFGPLRVDLEDGIFTGRLRLEIDIDGQVKKTNAGSLTGSWHMGLGGTPLMIFREASVIFTNGKVSFDMDPKRMEMPGLMKVLTDATKNMKFGGGGGGGAGDAEEDEVFKVGIVSVAQGIPAGIRATLDIPPINVSGGVAGITGLCFGGFFEMTALSPELRFRFRVGVGFYLGRKEAPFNLTVFILGGGGYIDGAVYYEPSAGGLAVDFAMSVHASVSFTIAMGWMSGGVSIMLGFEAEYHKLPSQRADFHASIFIQFCGHVEILSLVSVHLYLLLQATYKSLGNGGTILVGKGQVKLTIRISRFFKIKVNKTYEKVIAETKGETAREAFRAGPLGMEADVAPANIYQRRAASILASLK